MTKLLPTTEDISECFEDLRSGSSDQAAAPVGLSVLDAVDRGLITPEDLQPIQFPPGFDDALLAEMAKDGRAILRDDGTIVQGLNSLDDRDFPTKALN